MYLDYLLLWFELLAKSPRHFLHSSSNSLKLCAPDIGRSLMRTALCYFAQITFFAFVKCMIQLKAGPYEWVYWLIHTDVLAIFFFFLIPLPE